MELLVIRLAKTVIKAVDFQLQSNFTPKWAKCTVVQDVLPCGFYVLKVFEVLAIRKSSYNRAIPKLKYKMSAWPPRFLILLFVLYWHLIFVPLWLQNTKRWKYVISFVSVLILTSCIYTDFFNNIKSSSYYILEKRCRGQYTWIKLS